MRFGPTRMLPRDPREPLAVHVLTSVPDYALFHDLWDQNALLASPAARKRSARARRGWVPTLPPWRPRTQTDQHRQLVLDRDVAAGDDDYLFFSINASMHSRSTPAVAYRLSDLCRRSRAGTIGFRPHDLEGAYGVVDDHAADFADCGCAADDDCSCTVYDAFFDVLPEIADQGTAFGAVTTMHLAQLHLAALAGASGMWKAAAQIVAKKLAAERECHEALLTDRDEPDAYALDYTYKLICQGVGNIWWDRPFRGWVEPGGPEIVYRGGLRLHDAAFVRLPDGWREVLR